MNPDLVLFCGTLFLLILFGGVYYVLIQTLIGVPYVPSSTNDLVNLLKKLEISPSSHPKFLDLGSGDGRITMAISKLGFDSYGFETNPYLLSISKFWNLIKGTQANFKYQTIYTSNLSEFDIVYAYLTPKALYKIEEQLQHKHNQPKILITHTFKFRDLEPTEAHEGEYYIYKFTS